MDKTVDDYSQSLVDLERQKKQLEQMMKKMGEEWEESGAGIGWLNSIQSSTCTSSIPKININQDYLQQKLINNNSEEKEEENINDDLMSLTSPLTPEENKNLYSFFNHQRHSPDYLDSLLTMNETLLAQSDHTNTSFSSNNIPTICTTNVTSSSSFIMSPPITPDEKDKNNTIILSFHSK